MTSGFEDAFDSDPFASVNHHHDSRSHRSGDKKKSSSKSHTPEPDYGYGYEYENGDNGKDSSNRRSKIVKQVSNEELTNSEEAEGGRGSRRTGAGRLRRRASVTNVTASAAAEEDSRRADYARSASCESLDGADPARRARRHRRASVTSSTPTTHEVAPPEPDYGYGDAHRSGFEAHEDYGYGDGAPHSAAAAAVPAGGGRRRGRRMSVGGGIASTTSAEVDYGYGDAAPVSTYDEKFRKAVDSEDDAEPGVRRSDRNRRVDVNGILSAESLSEESRRAPPRTSSNVISSITAPDVQSNRPRRRASLVGSALDTVSKVVTAPVSVTLKKLDDPDKPSRKSRIHSAEMDVSVVPDGTRDRRHRGTLVDRFA